MIDSIANCHCNVGDVSVNISGYADDTVLLSPSWRVLQFLISSLFIYAQTINMKSARYQPSESI